MNVRNVSERKAKYFYTVLFLNDYYPDPDPRPSATEPQTKVFNITKDINSANVKWIVKEEDGEQHYFLKVNHFLPLPLTLQMWDAEGNPIFYCPILQDDVQLISIGGVTIEKNSSLLIDFGNGNPDCGCIKLPERK
jgi:hypothetical protein